MTEVPQASDVLRALGTGDQQAWRAVTGALMADAQEWFAETPRPNADLPATLPFAFATARALHPVLAGAVLERPDADWPDLAGRWREELAAHDPRPVLAVIWRVVAGLDNVKGGDDSTPLTDLPIEESLRLEFVCGQPETVDLVVDAMLSGSRRRPKLGLHDAEDCCRDVVRSAMLEPWRSWRTMLRHWVTVASKRMRRPVEEGGREVLGATGLEVEDDNVEAE